MKQTWSNSTIYIVWTMPFISLNHALHKGGGGGGWGGLTFPKLMEMGRGGGGVWKFLLEKGGVRKNGGLVLEMRGCHIILMCLSFLC